MCNNGCIGIEKGLHAQHEAEQCADNPCLVGILRSDATLCNRQTKWIVAILVTGWSSSSGSHVSLAIFLGLTLLPTLFERE